jgi:hypothetical protein
MPTDRAGDPVREDGPHIATVPIEKRRRFVSDVHELMGLLSEHGRISILIGERYFVTVARTVHDGYFVDSSFYPWSDAAYLNISGDLGRAMMRMRALAIWRNQNIRLVLG